jgi:hypothetical protein
MNPTEDAECDGALDDQKRREDADEFWYAAGAFHDGAPIE